MLPVRLVDAPSLSTIEAIVIIAQRVLTYAVPGNACDVMISLCAPVRGEREWSCAYEIVWPGEPRRGFGYGVDGAQALLLALQAIGTEIYTSNHHRSGWLYWEQPGQGYGFPVPSAIRDLLVGEDARLYG